MGCALVNRATENIAKVLALTREMIALADEGDAERADDSCGILFGMLRDMGYRLRRLAEEEKLKHQQQHCWD